MFQTAGSLPLRMKRTRTPAKILQNALHSFFSAPSLPHPAISMAPVIHPGAKCTAFKSLERGFLPHRTLPPTVVAWTVGLEMRGLEIVFHVGHGFARMASLGLMIGDPCSDQARRHSFLQDVARAGYMHCLSLCPGGPFSRSIVADQNEILLHSSCADVQNVGR